MSKHAPKLTGITLAIAAALAAREEEERERKSRIVKATKARLRQSGRHQGGRRRFGYRLEPAPDGGAQVEVPDPAEQQALKDIPEMRRRGDSLMAIRDALRARGHNVSHQFVAITLARAAGQPLTSKTNSRMRSVPRPRPALVSAPEPEAVPVIVETPAELQQALSEIRADLAKLTEQRSSAHQRERNERESVQPILRRLTEIERHLRLTETPQTPRTTRRHPMGA